MPSELPHVTQLSLTDDQFQALNALVALGVASASGRISQLLDAHTHLRLVRECLPSEAFESLIDILNAAGDANPNMIRTE